MLFSERRRIFEAGIDVGYSAVRASFLMAPAAEPVRCRLIVVFFRVSSASLGLVYILLVVASRGDRRGLGVLGSDSVSESDIFMGRANINAVLMQAWSTGVWSKKAAP